MEPLNDRAPSPFPRSDADCLFGICPMGPTMEPLLDSIRLQKLGRSCARSLPSCSLHLLEPHPPSPSATLLTLQLRITALTSPARRAMPHPRSIPGSSKSGTHKAFSEFDDIATKLLIDWAPREVIAYSRPAWNPPVSVRKMSLSSHGLPEDSLKDVCKVVSLLLSGDYDFNRCLDALLEIPYLRSYVDMLPDILRGDFVRHLRRYLKVHLPQCPFDVSATARYTGVTEDTRILARKDIKKGTTIKYLSGRLVPITPEEEDALAAEGLDFSILVSDRTGLSTLLGPARLLNHDCVSNARLVTVPRSKEVQVVTKRDIFPGEEITVDYGDQYFDSGNRECLCQTCETRRGVEHAESASDGQI
jgi:[histone H4]-N-methyl-L-lysine20 N-methyltransferase